MAKHTTRKVTNEARLETIRRRRVRKHKYASVSN
jgi:hypothetical protein